jgi:hypothetical protein
MFSLVTNASLADAERIRQVAPHWLRMFDRRVTELVVVLDPVPPIGRIAALHGPAAEPADVRAALREVSGLDSRVRVVDLPTPARTREVSDKWFRGARPVRCQAGTPILAFIYAIEQARSDVVLRADCDMLFHEAGWLSEAVGLVRSAAVDLVEPPRLGGGAGPVSTRALVLNPSSLRTRGRLPMRPHRLDVARRWHRWITGRPPWLALEQMLQGEVDAGRMSHRVLTGRGYSLHVASRGDMAAAVAAEAAARVERDDLPPGQRDDWNFRAVAWPPVA